MSRFPCGNTTCRHQAAITLGAKPCQPSCQWRVQWRSWIWGSRAASQSAECYWRSGPRWSILSVLSPVHPFPLRGTSPQGETRDMREKTASHILHVPFRRFPPLVPYGTTFPPQAGALWVLSNGAMSLQESIERFILPPEQGEVRRSPDRGVRPAWV